MRSGRSISSWGTGLIGDLLQQVMNTVEPGAFFVIGFDNIPGSFRDIGASERFFLRLGVILASVPAIADP